MTSHVAKAKLDSRLNRYFRPMQDSSIPVARATKSDFSAPGHDRLEKLLAIASLGEQTRGRRQAEQSLNEVRAHLNSLLGLYERLAASSSIDDAAAIVCRDAFEITNATAAAIAIEQGDEMFCRAAAGNPAPEVGVPVDIRAGLSGECIRSCISQRCDDTETDSRVNPVACRDMGIRSIAIVPLHRQGRAFGLLEVFSNLADAFSEDDVSALQLMAALLANEIGRIQSPKVAEQPELESKDAETGDQLAAFESSSDSAEQSATGFASFQSFYADEKPNPFLANRKWIAGAVLALLLVTVSWFAFRGSPNTHQQQSVAPAPKPVQVPASVASVDDLKQAADRGDAQAQFAMGVKYASGNDFPHDDKEAAKWITLSAEQGYQEAQTMLSLFYSAGRGLPKDLVQAYKWSAIAASKGDAAGAGQVRFLKTIMQPEQIRAADKEATQWLLDRQPLPSKNSLAKQ